MLAITEGDDIKRKIFINFMPSYGKNTRTRAITGIDGDIRINKALWMIAEQFREWKS
ncbi:hypothetical protein G0T53_001751 [Shigella flexneri]|nr:hypothetical protein [Shigella flexneri]